MWIDVFTFLCGQNSESKCFLPQELFRNDNRFCPFKVLTDLS